MLVKRYRNFYDFVLTADFLGAFKSSIGSACTCVTAVTSGLGHSYGDLLALVVADYELRIEHIVCFFFFYNKSSSEKWYIWLGRNRRSVNNLEIVVWYIYLSLSFSLNQLEYVRSLIVIGVNKATMHWKQAISRFMYHLSFDKFLQDWLNWDK